MFYVGQCVMLCVVCALCYYHPLLVLAVTLSVYDGCVAVAGGGRHPPCPPGSGPRPGQQRTRAGTRPGGQRHRGEQGEQSTGQLQLAGGAGRWQLGALTRVSVSVSHQPRDTEDSRQRTPGGHSGLVILHSQDPDQDMVTL